MKKIILISIVFLMFFLVGFSQDITGPVLKKELAGKYEGEQKKGLANGKGTATGTDTYTGDFLKGLPDGIGVYTDSNGNVYKGSFLLGVKEGKGEFQPSASSTEKPMTGYWMDDKYIGKDKINPYEISNKIGSVSPRIYSTGPGNVIDITVIDPYDNSNTGATIQLIGQGSPREDTSYKKYYYDDVKFPVEFDIRYQVRNKIGGMSMNASMTPDKVSNAAAGSSPLRQTSGGVNNDTPLVNNSIHIKINKPGKWSITLKN
jgi:hypothetical protein